MTFSSYARIGSQYGTCVYLLWGFGDGLVEVFYGLTDVDGCMRDAFKFGTSAGSRFTGALGRVASTFIVHYPRLLRVQDDVTGYDSAYLLDGAKNASGGVLLRFLRYSRAQFEYGRVSGPWSYRNGTF